MKRKQKEIAEPIQNIQVQPVKKYRPVDIMAQSLFQAIRDTAAKEK